MRKFGLLGTSAIRSAAFIGFTMALASPSFAQGTGEGDDDPATLQSEPEVESGVDATTGAQGEGAATGDADQVVTVTGSRIRRPNLESTVPITSLGGEEFFQQGQTNIGETLNELPALRSTFAQSNPGLGIGIAGLNLLDLRGLGTQRTLVLVNGRRHVAADILNNAVSPDVNTIPNDLIERVDIVTGGNSAVYGSDAIAGVVNFILRRDFDGVQIRGNAGVSEEGYGGNQYVSAMAGKNFADGRANVTIHGEYAHQRRVYTSDVPFLRQNDALGVVDADPAGTPNGSDGIPDRVFIRDQRSRSINRFGLVPITQPFGAPACGVGVSNGVAPGTPYNCAFLFNSAGDLAPLTGSTFTTGVIGGATGGNGQTGRERGLFSVLPFYERYNANLLAHFTISEALEPFVEAKFSRVNVKGSNFGPGGIQGTFTQFDTRERVRLDNPFLDPSERTTIANAILASGCKPSLTVACNVTTNPNAGGPLTAADRAAIAAGTFRFVIARNLLDVQARDESFSRDTFRVVGGLRGTFNEDWSYEVSANYGRTEEETQAEGYVNKQRFLLSLDAGRDPATGQIRCRSQFDPAARIAFPNNAANQGTLAADVAACVPYNPFGQADNSAAAAYFAEAYTVDAWADQFVLQGFVSGDTSGFFELWGGPIRFAMGAEYRKEQAYYEQSESGASGRTNAVAFGTFDPPPFEVKEAFGEIQIPIFKDMPFFEDLTVSAAGRVADYKGATGTVFAYNAGVEWSPIRDIRFRANYGRAIRAPNSAETFGELIPNFAPGFTDPCAATNIGAGSQFRGANCQADLGPLLSNIPTNVRSLPVLSGVNPNLQEETSKSLTVGAVLQPRFLPGFSLTVDYYDIKVDDVIASASAQQIANGCYDLPTLQNPFCALFERFRGTGAGPFGESPGEIQGNTLVQAPLNYASRVRKGIDFEAAYRTNLGTNSRLSSRLIYSHQLKNSNFQNPTNPTFENRLLSELGDPQDEFRFDLDLSYKAFTLGYELRYISGMYVNAYEDFNSLNGLPPQDADYADFQKYPQVFYHDLRFDWNIKNTSGLGRDMNVFFGVDNIFDRNPPFGLTGTGAGSAIYPIRGRNFYGGFRARF